MANVSFGPDEPESPNVDQWFETGILSQKEWTGSVWSPFGTGDTELVVSSLTSGTPHSVSTVTTASVSADAGDLLILWVASAGNGGGGGLWITGVTATGLTFSQAETNGGGIDTLAAYTAQVPVGGFAGTVVIAFNASADAVNYDLDKVSGSDFSGPLVVSNNQTAAGVGPYYGYGSSALTFDAAAQAENLFVYGCLVEQDTTQSASESPSWTVLANLHQNPVRYLGLTTQVSPDASDTAASSYWGSYDHWYAIGLEIQAG